jgi:hypothetical protein
LRSEDYAESALAAVGACRERGTLAFGSLAGLKPAATQQRRRKADASPRSQNARASSG